MFLAHGVTGVREMGSDCEEPDDERPCLAGLRAWAAAIERGELVGPRLLALSSWIVSNDRQVEDPGALLDDFVERGVDFVKVLQGLSADAYFALMAAARERDLPVAGHVPLSVGAASAAEAGQVSIEHARDLLFDGYPDSVAWRRTTDTQNPPTAVLRRMIDQHDPERVQRVASVWVEHGTRYVPTHVTRRFDALADDPGLRSDPRRVYVHPLRWDDWVNDAESVLERDPSPAGRRVFRDFYERGLEATGTALAAGVEVLAGTDANDSFIFPGSSLHEELSELVRAGLSPAQALRASTWAAADFLARTDDFGSIERGKKADLVLLSANPLEAIENTRAIEAVVFDGRFHDRGALEGWMAGVAAFVAGLHPEAEVPAAVLASYVGRYEAPMGDAEVALRSGDLFFALPGRSPMRLRPVSETAFALLPRDASVVFQVDDDGTVEGLRFEQGGRGGMARKIE